ncbi:MULTISPECIES: vWA domain-containing protein [unclassified Anaerobiospirillum]|uniref:vWA domain-containing protein n=1 Tax=unclassified Anaerobiospirillum TaxID=2647410 RepID=UPI001FF1ACEB|nr:VWA domain-containing protein [Anaerobiospirillum sp. NML120511]MCK0539251.1 VWA domain-containing protein [Anaerobiospirillum sp. NML02-A-032]
MFNSFFSPGRKAGALTALAMAVAMAVTSGQAAAAQSTDRKPLLMEGKTTLYQRVLSTPACLLHEKADASDAGRTVPALSQYYVYGEQGNMYEVGSDSIGTVSGFMKKDCAVPWKMQLALMFTNPANRNRALIFEQETALDQIIDNEDGASRYKKLYDQVAKTKTADNVISIEPEEYVDYQQKFYLLPILNSVESMYPDGSLVYKHEIASITAKEAANAASATTAETAGSSTAGSAGSQGSAAGSGTAADAGTKTAAAGADKPPAAGADPAAQAGDPTIVSFKSAVVFVIDSSISMRPYIERTKKAVNSIYKSIESAGLNDSVHFGLVSFRADTRKVPGLEYTSKVYLRPGEASTAEEFNKKVASLDQAKVSSSQFDEDAYAGIDMALKEVNWNDYGGRYIVLITDAGAIGGSDRESSTGLDAAALRMEADHYGAAIYTMHLLTSSGKKTHKKAREQYEDLSFNQVLNKPLYYPVNAGSVESFGSMVDTLSRSLTNQVQLATQGMMAAGSSLSATEEQPAEPAPEKATQEQNNALQEDSRKLGLAMQLAYLGRVKGTESPEFLKGWMYDRDVDDHNKQVCAPVVLVNRNQLSDLYNLVNGVLQAGIAGQLSSEDMFTQLQALAAQMGRDPSQLSKSSSIGEMGIMGELLDELPYKSTIASMNVEDWNNMGSQEQEERVRALENSLKYIQHCAGDNDRFIRLNEDADSSEEVYPIPLEALP